MIVIRLVTIYNKKTIEEDIPEIGLYSTSEGSEFRWCEAPVNQENLYGYTPILTAISDATTKVDLSHFGGVEQYNTTSFSVVNLSQINILMEDMDFPVIGSKVVCEDYYPETGENKITYTGIIDTFSADDREIEFNCEAWELKKDLNLSTKIITGPDGNFPFAPEGVKDQILPLCFGESNPEDGRFFKIPCTKKVWKILTQQDICELIGCDPTYSNQPPDATTFPVHDIYPLPDNNIVHRVRLGNVKLTGITQEYLDKLNGMYVYVEKQPDYVDRYTDEEKPAYQGESRRINGVRLVSDKTEGEYAQIEIDVKDIVLWGDELGNDRYQTFINIIDKGLTNPLEFLYVWKTSLQNLGFRQGEKIHLGDDKKLVPTGGNDVVVNGSSISVRPKENFFPERDMLQGYKLYTLPAVITPIDSLDNLSYYNDEVFYSNQSPWDDMGFFWRVSGNYYRAGNYYPTFNLTPNTELMSADPQNNDFTKYMYASTTEVIPDEDSTGNYIRAFRFPLPVIDMEFSELYLLISLECDCYNSQPPLLGLKRYLGMSSWAISDLDEFDGNFKLDCMPSSFYKNYPENDRDNFYLLGETIEVPPKWKIYSGYKNYLCEGIDSLAKYKSYDHGILFLPRAAHDHSYTEILKIRQILLMIKVTENIGDYIYV